jgi:magnesium chelatase family protein
MSRTGSRNWITVISVVSWRFPASCVRSEVTLAVALEARKRRRERLIVPHQNAAEAAVVDGVAVYGVTSLSEVVQFLRGEKELTPVPTQPWTAHRIRDESDFSEVKGQYHVRRAVEVAAAGAHNLFKL